MVAVEGGGQRQRDLSGWAPIRSGGTSTAACSTGRGSRCWSGSRSASLAVAVGLVIGLLAGYFRRLDGLVMRLMDGLMAIPGILLALALVSLWGAGAGDRDPRDRRAGDPACRAAGALGGARVREEPYVEAAIGAGHADCRPCSGGTSCPARIAPLIVQGTYIAASAILVEAILSFLGVGIPTEIPSWGNIMAEGRDAVSGVSAQHLLPGPVPGADGAGGEHGRRRAARRAGSQAGQAGVTTHPKSRIAWGTALR